MTGRFYFMDTDSTKHGGRFRARTTVAVASSAISLALIVFGLGARTESPEKDPSVTARGTAQAQPRGPIRAWNVALGNVVVVAPELGFQIKTGKGSAVEQPNLVSKIESQLQSLREIYRLESDKNTTLMGGMTLQFDISPWGEISQVKEIASRITDTEFKKAVMAEVSKWSFEKTASDSVTVNCPLLFVREGMDITTVVQWEKSLGQFSDRGAVAKNNLQPALQSKAAETAKPVVANTVANPSKVSPSSSAAIRPAGTIYIKYATSLRREPNFSSMPLARFTPGMKVTLLSTRGPWLEVRTDDNAQSGFIRKEFVGPLDLAQKQMARD